VSCKVEHTKAHLTKLKRDTKVKVLQSELNIKIMEITEEQIKEAHNAACSQWKQKIEQWFPECFKQKLEAGKWYKHFDSDCKEFLFCFNEFGDKNYGFDEVGKWSNKLNVYEKYSNGYVEATTKEVESMLVREAEKRGFIDGVTVSKIDNYYKGMLNTMIIGEHEFELYGDVLVAKSTNNYYICLMADGKWATIVEKPKEMTLEEIEKQLGHKVKIVS